MIFSLRRVAAVQASHASPFAISNLRHWVKKNTGAIFTNSLFMHSQKIVVLQTLPMIPFCSAKNKKTLLLSALVVGMETSECYFDVNFHMLMLLNEVQVHLEYPLQNLIIEVDSLSVALTVLEF